MSELGGNYLVRLSRVISLREDRRMLMEVTVYDKQRVKRGWAQLELNFANNKWSLQEGDGWAGVSSSNPPGGTFVLKPWDVLWLMEERQGKQEDIVIIWTPPRREGDPERLSGQGVISNAK